MCSIKTVTDCNVQSQHVTGWNVQCLTVVGHTVQQSVAYISCLGSISVQIQPLGRGGPHDAVHWSYIKFNEAPDEC